MSLNNRAGVVSFVEESYFGNVSANNIDAVMECFHSDATVLIRHGDKPPRHFAVEPDSGESHLREFYTHLCGSFEARFEDFSHFIDLEANGSACYFTVRLTPRSADMLDSVGVQVLRNCNFFHYRGGKIERMMIYYANSAAETADAKPTGYPA